MEEPRIVERKQQGAITTMVDGQLQRIPCELTIIDTYHADGRKDCEVRVPCLKSKPTLNQGV